MKRLLFSVLLLCLCPFCLFAQQPASDEDASPEGPDRTIYWTKTNLYYYIHNSSNNLTSSQCQTAIQNAFSTWAQGSRFTFTQTTNQSQADIELSWEIGSHGSCPSFYENTVVAHSSQGKISNRTPPAYIHFNDDYTFSTNGTQNDVESVALREIGHVLGLGYDYNNSLRVMYYNIPPGTTKRNLTSYDIIALYNLYSHPSSITGPKLIYTYGIFTLDVVPTDATIEWTLPVSNYNNGFNFLPNCPEIGKCRINRNNSHDLKNQTLTATIKYNNVVVQTLTTVVNAYDDFWGQYTSGSLSGEINYSHTFGVKANTVTTVTSPNFYGATVTYDSSSGATPTAWGFHPTNGLLNFTAPAGNVPVVINVHDGCGNDYTLYAFISSYSINVSCGEDGIIVLLVEDGDASKDFTLDEPWTLEIINATTGRVMAKQSSTSRSETISTAGWPKGIYVVKVTIGKEELTEKVIVK